MVVPIGKESPGLWVDVSVCVPELSVAVGAVQDTKAESSPLSVLPDWVLGQPLTTGLSLSVTTDYKSYKVASNCIGNCGLGLKCSFSSTTSIASTILEVVFLIICRIVVPSVLLAKKL